MNPFLEGKKTLYFFLVIYESREIQNF